MIIEDIGSGNIRTDERFVPDDTSEVRLFSKIKNEELRLRYFLDWYRNLGVSRFFIIDNCSTDRTLEVLSNQPDVHLFINSENMKYSHGGMKWISPLLNQYGNGHWCIIADADELLVYPDYEAKSLPTYCDQLDTAGFDAFFCMMIDMYPGSTQEVKKYRSGDSFIEFSPYFDRSGYTPVPTSDDRLVMRGGPRLRLFYPELINPSRWTLLKREILFKASYKNSFLAPLRPAYPPIISKVPLVKWNPALRYGGAAHWVTPANLARCNGALLHFKFLGDFMAKVNDDNWIKAYHNDGAEYRRFREAINNTTSAGFMCDLSERYIGSMQLVKLGLIGDVIQEKFRISEITNEGI